MRKRWASVKNLSLFTHPLPINQITYQLSVYVDGVCVDSTLTGETRPSDATKYDLVIGAMTEDFNGTFKGKIDEVRLSNVSCSMDWIRLCYMNQKIDDALVVFK